MFWLTLIISFIIIIFGFDWIYPEGSEYWKDLHIKFKPDNPMTGTISYDFRFYFVAVISILSMLCGMLCYQVFVNIQKIEESGKDTIDSFKKLLSDSIRGTKFLMAIIVSPIVYISVLKIIGGIESVLMVILFSFQNGFFWITVFHFKKPKIASRKRRV